MGSIKIKGATSGSMVLTVPDTGADNVPVDVAGLLASISHSHSEITNTNLGDDAHSLQNFDTPALWSKPAGYQTMVRASTSNGLPTNHGQSYFGYMVTSRRDTGTGYSAILSAYDNSKHWITYNINEAAYPIWKEIGGNFDAGKSHYQSGYQKLSNGLIIQWGLSSADPTYFPISFPSACFSVVATVYNGNNDYEASLVHTITASSFRFKNKYYNKARYYIAIGH